MMGDRMPCMIPGCDRDTRSPYTGRLGAICGPHWFRLTLDTRRRWWKETSYGKQPPTREMVAVIVDELTSNSSQRKAAG